MGKSLDASRHSVVHRFPGLKPRATKNEVPPGLTSVGNTPDTSGVCRSPGGTLFFVARHFSAGEWDTRSNIAGVVRMTTRDDAGPMNRVLRCCEYVLPAVCRENLLLKSRVSSTMWY